LKNNGNGTKEASRSVAALLIIIGRSVCGNKSVPSFLIVRRVNARPRGRAGTTVMEKDFVCLAMMFWMIPEQNNAKGKPHSLSEQLDSTKGYHCVAMSNH
jgi:hypothetical protein